eukprot:1141193-Pelagomonas_calceolata.AAC.6
MHKKDAVVGEIHDSNFPREKIQHKGCQKRQSGRPVRMMSSSTGGQKRRALWGQDAYGPLHSTMVQVFSSGGNGSCKGLNGK